MKPILSFLRLPSTQKLLALQIFILLGWMRFLIKFKPFKTIVSRYQLSQKRIPFTPEGMENNIQREYILTIRYLLNTISAFTPWESTCLTKALVGWYLLKVKNIRSYLYIGVTHNKNSLQLNAHAWLDTAINDIEILTGDNQYFLQEYKILAVYY